MKYAICMLVHKKPALLEQISKRLADDNVEIFIHLDKKCDISEYNHIPDVTFINKRIRVYWGGRSMVKAMFNLIEHVVLNTDSEYLMFISGEDYPVVLPQEYDKYINVGNNYFEYEKLPKNDWYLFGLNRIKYYYLFQSPKSLKNKIYIKLQSLCGIKRNLDKLPFDIYGGSQWININRITAEYIMYNWKSYYSFFKFCLIPDEMIFQTIVLNSDFKNTVINTNYRYLLYDNNSSNAAYINYDNIKEIIRIKPLFCRKIKDNETIKQLNEFSKI